MSTQRPTRSLPNRPDIRHLKNQAKDMLRAGTAASLTAAQLTLAREYGFPSWPKLKSHVESLREIGRLKEAIDSNDVDMVKAMMTTNPDLHRAPLGYGSSGPLTWTAECRGVPPSDERIAIARWMIENGSDVHQGGDGPLMRAALSDDRIPMMELLVAHGADVNAMWDGRYPIVCAPCETLQPRALKWLLQRGADLNVASKDYGSCVDMMLGTYSRNPDAKHECLDVFAQAHYPFPDTATMAIHRGRIDLLEKCLAREPAIFERAIREAEIYPFESIVNLGGGLHGAPLDGATLLHMATEYHEAEIAQWLVDKGADVNAPADIDADGFGGHTPLFHTSVTIGPKTEKMARLLLRNGADPNVRATFRRRIRPADDAQAEQIYEYRDATAIEFARQFQDPRYINEAAIEAISTA